MIRVSCPCGTSVEAPPEFAGGRISCPSCASSVTVPGLTNAIPRQSSDRGRALPVEEAKRVDAVRPVPNFLLPRRSRLAALSLLLGLFSFPLTFVAGIPAIVTSLLARRAIRRSAGRKTGQGLATAGLVTGIFGTMLTIPAVLMMALGPAHSMARVRFERVETMRHLQKIGQALLKYHDDHGHFPLVSGNEGMHPELSWRVAILPYLGPEEARLYKRFNLRDGWAGGQNALLWKQMPLAYQTPNTVDPPGLTYFRVVVGPGALFESNAHGRARRFADVQDGPANTLMVAEGKHAVPWTKADELVYVANGPLPELGRHADGFHVLLADASVRWLPRATPDATLRSLITINGGEVINWP